MPVGNSVLIRSIIVLESDVDNYDAEPMLGKDLQVHRCVYRPSPLWSGSINPYRGLGVSLLTDWIYLTFSGG